MAILWVLCECGSEMKRCLVWPCLGKFLTLRSIGDKVAQSVGVIPDPEILEYTLSPNDQFILLASDGVWEFMSNVDVARLVYPYVEKNAPEAAANALVKEATK